MNAVALAGVALAVAVAVAAAVGFYATRFRPSVAGPVTASHFDRIIVLVLESYRSDEVDPVAIASNPFLTKLVREK